MLELLAASSHLKNKLPSLMPEVLLWLVERHLTLEDIPSPEQDVLEVDKSIMW